MIVVSRREFIGACAGTVLVAGAEPSTQPSHYVYACESHWGGYKDTSGRLVIGLLITSAPGKHLEAIADVKKRTKYRRAISSGSNDSFMVGCAREMVRYFVTSKELRFAARVARATVKDLELESFRVGHLVDAFGDAKVAASATVRMKRRQTRWYTSRPDAGIREHDARVEALRSKRAIKDIEAIVRKKHDGLLELSSLLTGLLFNTAVWGEPRSAGGITTGTAIRLRTALGVKSLLMSVPGTWDVVVKT